MVAVPAPASALPDYLYRADNRNRRELVEFRNQRRQTAASLSMAANRPTASAGTSSLSCAVESGLGRRHAAQRELPAFAAIDLHLSPGDVSSFPCFPTARLPRSCG